MRKMKVAEVITRLDWAGSPDIVRIICESLADRYEITLITGPGKHKSEKTERFLREFKGEIIVVPSLSRNINPIRDFSALIRLYKIFKREEFDIVHTHTAKAGLLGRMAARMACTSRIIHMPHGHNFYGYFGPLVSRLIVGLERFAGRFTDKIIVLTELAKRDFLSFEIKDPEDIAVVPSGLELRDFDVIDAKTTLSKKKELGLEENEQVVGMVGRLEPIKGPQYFIEAAREVASAGNEIRFLIVGDGALRPDLERIAGELAVKDKIVFLGWREDILEIISCLDILVLPSLNEAVGRVLLEAQALGVPVVATNVGGIPDVVRDGTTGILVPPEDSKAMGRAICRLLDDKEKRQGFSREARKWVRERFCSEKMVEGIVKVYESSC